MHVASEAFLTNPNTVKMADPTSSPTETNSDLQGTMKTTIKPTPNPTLQKSLRRISLHPTLTPYRRRVYRVLLSVPEGRWTTYSAMATYLNSSARAVGNAMRTNPFAPEVPCHRVLAADRSLGGYKGEWKVSKHIGSGSFRDEKRLRLKEEGVVFDEDGKAGGICFREFRDLAAK
jgi:methylated-DNA-[protein]-cysteine S-methyltransferase